VILVDTSVWIDHLRRGDTALAGALDRGEVLMHPIVLGEVACGNLRRRGEVLSLMRDLPRSPVATDDEALAFIESRELMGRGIGYADVHLLASVALEPGATLWTGDRRLAAVAGDVGLPVRDG
jgi:hypothetical protein